MVYDVLHARSIPTGDSKVTRLWAWSSTPLGDISRLNPPIIRLVLLMHFVRAWDRTLPCVLSRRSNPTDGDEDNDH
jgi:hypothetical protein